MVPVGFLVKTPQLANLMMEWLWRERKNKKTIFLKLVILVVVLLFSDMKNT
jgi:UDP-N-acetyl-D-mannosaminuronic acid transferase (WecB/TagA/CpsF family)